MTVLGRAKAMPNVTGVRELVMHPGLPGRTLRKLVLAFTTLYNVGRTLRIAIWLHRRCATREVIASSHTAFKSPGNSHEKEEVLL
jgi:hypothetical protein